MSATVYKKIKVNFEKKLRQTVKKNTVKAGMQIFFLRMQQ